MFEGDPAAFAVYENGEQVSPVLSQRQALWWIERNRDVADLREALRMIRITLDERDTASLTRRQAARDALPRVPLEGDVVRFSDGVEYRVSYAWDTDHGTRRVQTTRGGSFSWGSSGHMSYSGSLFDAIDSDTMTLTDETANVPAWFFHHEWACAHNGVNVKARVRVWTTTAERPES